MVEQLDAGPILHQVAEPIGPEETAADLTTRLSEVGAEALIEALAMLELGAIEELAQDDGIATYAPKLTRENAHIDWSRTAQRVMTLEWIEGIKLTDRAALVAALSQAVAARPADRIVAAAIAVLVVGRARRGRQRAALAQSVACRGLCDRRGR